jgi:hypothetical protein
MPQDSTNRRLKGTVAASRIEDGTIAAKPSKKTLEEVLKLFKQYSNELESNAELSQTSKTMYTDFAKCFVRWMNGEFKPGYQGSNGRTRRKLITKVWHRHPLD